MDKYVVRGYVKRIGRRDTLSNPMSKTRAKEFKKGLEDKIKISIPKYKWVENIRIKKLKMAKNVVGKRTIVEPGTYEIIGYTQEGSHHTGTDIHIKRKTSGLVIAEVWEGAIIHNVLIPRGDYEVIIAVVK